MTELELIIDFHKDAEQQGPGSPEETLRAFELTGMARDVVKEYKKRNKILSKLQGLLQLWFLYCEEELKKIIKPIKPEIINNRKKSRIINIQKTINHEKQ